MQPIQSPSEHYRESERILASLPALGLDAESAGREIGAALVHAVLATVAPRNARPGKGRRDVATGRDRGGSPRERWIHGHDDDGGAR